MNEAARHRRFRYVARDKTGRRSAASLSAADRNAAIAELRRQGLYTVSLEVEDGDDGATAASGSATAADPPRASATARSSGTAGGRAKREKPPRPLNLREQATLVEALARLIEQKVTPDRALLIIGRGRTGAVAQAAAAARRQVRTGSGLADALVKGGALSDTAASALMIAGDAAGDTGGALSTAARVLNGRVSARRKLISGLIYPLVLLTVSVASIALVLVGIIPEFRPLVDDRFELVPPLGRMVFALSAGLTALWPLVLLGLLAAAGAVAVLARRGRLGPVLLRVASALPLLGRAVEDNRAMLQLRILGSLLERRLPLDRAIAILALAPSDPQRLERVRAIGKRIEQGEALSDACEAEALMPGSAIEMMRIGEETGTLPAMLLRAADDLEETSSQYMSRVLIMIEPALVVLVGCIIGVSLYALFTAITAVNATAF